MTPQVLIITYNVVLLMEIWVDGYLMVTIYKIYSLVEEPQRSK